MPFYEEDINTIIRDDFLEYAGHVMQERSVPDARDALKDGARKILYIQYKDKNIHTKNFIKGAAAVGQILKCGYLHGDASAYATLVHMGKQYAYPYVFEELQGNVGNQVSPDNHAHMRYLELRQSELASYLFDGIEKNSIEEWYDNYANTMQLPRVLPTVGIYPLVNGFSGIAVGLATSYPSTNLREVNDTIIRLMRNPNLSDEDVYCAPDFPMGGTIINGTEVKESMLAGSGKAVKMRAKIEYDPNKNMLIATQIPFSVYTDTIDHELAELINGKENCGITKYIDATNDEGGRIHIYLEKGANVKKVIKLLYKVTSLESYYTINLIMLEDGRFPRIYTWKNALLAYIAHIRSCKRREIEFDLDKALARKNVVDGLIIAAANIDEVVAIIRSAQNPQEASVKLIARFGFNEEQVKAILAMRLSSLTKIDSIKLDNELAELKVQIDHYRYMLNDSVAIDDELVKILQEVANKFGDERRTKVIDLVEEEEQERVEEKPVRVLLLSNGKIRLLDDKATKKDEKLGRGISITQEFTSTNLSSFQVVTNLGRMYQFPLSSLTRAQDYSFAEILPLNDGEQPLLTMPSYDFFAYHYLVTVSSKGYIKKTATNEYVTHRGKRGANICKLESDEELVLAAACMEEDEILLFNNVERYARYAISEINALGKTARGVKAMKMEDTDTILAATALNKRATHIQLGKHKLSISSFAATGRNSKGRKNNYEVDTIQVINEE